MAYDFYVKTKQDLIDALQEYGVIPYFAGSIPGFSLEEHCPGYVLFNDTEENTWEWKGPVIRATGCAYGKFFDRKAGFISMPWFPIFANYRRDGYDYEGMYEDGKLNGRGKKILDTLQLDEDAAGLEMMSGELRKRAAVEKGFDNVLIDLQMQSFLLISRFGQKRNKRGEAYGWHLPFFMTPETKWGYDAVNSCSEKPEVSRERLMEQMRKICPEASKQEIRKILGIRK